MGILGYRNVYPRVPVIKNYKSYYNYRNGYRLASNARFWKSYRTYRNKHRGAYSTPSGPRLDIGLLPQWTPSSLRGQIEVRISESKAIAVGAVALRKEDEKERDEEVCLMVSSS